MRDAAAAPEETRVAEDTSPSPQPEFSSRSASWEGVFCPLGDERKHLLFQEVGSQKEQMMVKEESGEEGCCQENGGFLSPDRISDPAQRGC